MVELDSDEALTALGSTGRWQMFSYLYITFILGTSALFAMMSIVFVGMQPSFHCTLPEGVSVNESVPWETVDDVTRPSQCKVYVNWTSVSNETMACPDGWTYDISVSGRTIVSDWDLVCDRSVLTETSQLVTVLGVMLGSILGSAISDKWGRKPVFTISIVTVSVLSFVLAWVDNYYLFVCIKFVTGVLQQAIVLPGFVLACELFPPSARTIAGLMAQCMWALSMIIMALFAYLLKDWRHLLIFCAFPGVVAIPAFWVVSESIPWLVAKGRIREAKLILKRAAWVNGIKLPDKYVLTEEEEKLLSIIDESKDNNNPKKYSVVFKGAPKRRKSSFAPAPDLPDGGKDTTFTVLDILRSCRLTCFSLMMCFLWCTSAMVYYGLSLSTGSLAGDPYLNFALSGVIELVAYTLSAFALQFIGRRWPIWAYHIIAGVALFITIFVPDKTVNMVLSMIGKFGITGTFGCIFLWAPELFPTTLRNIGIGISSVGGRFGNLVAPYTSFVARQLPWLPNVVFGVACLIGAVFTMLLPETLGRPLPQTIREVEQWTLTLSAEEKQRYKDQKAASQAAN